MDALHISYSIMVVSISPVIPNVLRVYLLLIHDPYHPRQETITIQHGTINESTTTTILKHKTETYLIIMCCGCITQRLIVAINVILTRRKGDCDLANNLVLYVQSKVVESSGSHDNVPDWLIVSALPGFLAKHFRFNRAAYVAMDKQHRSCPRLSFKVSKSAFETGKMYRKPSLLPCLL